MVRIASGMVFLKVSLKVSLKVFLKVFLKERGGQRWPVNGDFAMIQQVPEWLRCRLGSGVPPPFSSPSPETINPNVIA